MDTPSDPSALNPDEAAEPAGETSDFPQIDVNRETKKAKPPAKAASAKTNSSASKAAKPDKATGKKPSANDFFKNNQTLVLSGVSAGLLLIVFFLFMFAGSNSAYLEVIKWKSSDRKGVTLKIDGRSQKFSSSDSLKFTIKPGTHVVDFIRPDGTSNRFEFAVKAGNTNVIDMSKRR